ncbi:hypothetical protein EI94DRAFT_1924825 [Lactarius quietus]|nr:hypothetical protein EI94DRAFT_1924825 [Lactarius quietus]
MYPPLATLKSTDHFMSSTTLDRGHAVRADGTLKDASDMLWTYDADELLPFPPSTASRVPAPTVRRTTCTHRPSKRALEAAEAEAETEAANALAHAKHKATTDVNPTCHVTRKVDLDKSDSDSEVEVEVVAAADDPGDSDDDATTEPSMEPADDNYKILKAMADADHQAVTFKSR